MTPTSIRRLPATLLLLLPAAACGASQPSEPAAASPQGVTTHKSVTTVLYNSSNVENQYGLRYEFAPDVKFVWVQHSVAGQQPVTQATLNGLGFTYLADGFVLAGRRYADLEAGDKVRFSAAGIELNGTWRWDMPAE